jgi:alcohol dehydrogenase class IV
MSCRRFNTDVRIISGTYSLEKIPYELSNLGGYRPLILMRSRTSSQKVRLIKKVFAYAAQEIPAICFIGPETTEDEIDAVLDAVNKYSCDCMVAIGSGFIQSAAKLVNSLHSCRLRIDQRHSLPCKHANLLPSAAVLTEDTDGQEIGGRLQIFELDIQYEKLRPDIIVIEPRMLNEVSEASAACSALITMSQLTQALYEHADSPVIRSLLIPSFRLIGDWAGLLHLPRSRFALVNASIYAQIIFKNTQQGAVWSLSSVGDRSGITSRALITSVLLPPFVRMLITKQSTAVETIVAGVRILKSDAPTGSLWEQSAASEQNRLLPDLIDKLIKLSRFTDLPQPIDQLFHQIGHLVGKRDTTSMKELILHISHEREVQ